MEEEIWEFDDVRQDDQVDSMVKEDEIAPPIICPFYTDALIPILDQLDENSFTRLSMTCRYLCNTCFNIRGVKIPLDCVVDVLESDFRVWLGEKNHLYDKNPIRKQLNAAEIQGIVEKKSLRRFSVQMIRIGTVMLTGQCIKATHDFLTKIGCTTADRLWVACGVHVSAEELIQFVKELGAKEFRSQFTIPDDSISYFLKNMSYFYYKPCVPSDFNFQAKMPPRLHLTGGNTVFFYSFMKILKGWASGDFDIDEWNLSGNVHVISKDLTAAFLHHFDWVHIFELFLFPLPSARPLLLLQWIDFPRYMLRGDGQILGIFYSKEGDRGLFLRRMRAPHLLKKLPILFPTTDGRLFENIANPKNKK